jgi:hypothetical protein
LRASSRVSVEKDRHHALAWCFRKRVASQHLGHPGGAAYRHADRFAGIVVQLLFQLFLTADSPSLLVRRALPLTMQVCTSAKPMV